MSRTTIRRLFRIVNGGTPTADSANWDGGVVWITPEDLGSVDGGVLTVSRRTITESALRSSSAVLSAPGSIVVSTRAPIGYVAELGVPAATNQGCKTLVPRAEVDSRYFRYQVRSLRQELESRGQGSTFRELGADELATVPISAPPIDEQRAIADYLDRETSRIDRMITARQRLLALLDERLRAEIDQLVWAGNPNTILLGRIAKRIDVGIAEAATHAYADDGVPLLRSTNIRLNRIDRSDLLYIQPWFAEKHKSKTIFADDILTVRTGNAGVSAITPPDLAGAQCFTQLITTIRQPNSAAFYCYALNSGPARAYFQSAGWGSAQDNISVPILSRAPVPYVDPRKQEEVVTRIRIAELASTSAAKLLKRQMSLLEERRHRLIETATTVENPSGVTV